jgi:hypothetical protein
MAGEAHCVPHTTRRGLRRVPPWVQPEGWGAVLGTGRAVETTVASTIQTVDPHPGRITPSTEEGTTVELHTPVTRDVEANGEAGQLMAQYGITQAPGPYVYGGYHYDKLTDAVHYAQRQQG